jgi:SAM-dependent methyltransferase
MGVLDHIHGSFVYGRRVRVLARELAALLPEGARVLDVGCGDGLIARLILDQRPDLDLSGLDVLVRPKTRIAVAGFDGRHLPLGDRAVDVVMFVDVLHHTDDPAALLAEAARVARHSIVLKDHLSDGLLAAPVLRFMDWVANDRYGVRLPYNYWPRRRWEESFAALGLRAGAWKARLGLYPRPASWLFDGSLHFIARLDVTR